MAAGQKHRRTALDEVPKETAGGCSINTHCVGDGGGDALCIEEVVADDVVMKPPKQEQKSRKGGVPLQAPPMWHFLLSPHRYQIVQNRDQGQA
eukprot:scaffold8610_cov70-Cyclotella_meneghiniana.AAC.1